MDFRRIWWRGWLGVAKVSFLNYLVAGRPTGTGYSWSWARPAVLVAGKGIGGMFFFSSVS